MGFFSNLFGKDWQAELDRVERDLAADDPVVALERARKAEKGAPEGPIRGRATELVDRSRAAIIERARKRCDQAVAEGNFDDAVDWLRAALAHEEDPQRRLELERRQGELAERAERERSPFGTDLRRGGRRGASEAQEDEGVADHRWEAWLATLRDDLAERWEAHGARFEAAVVTLNDGDAAAALVLFDQVAQGAPSDPVVRFERGRARLSAGDAVGAREDFEAAWSELGVAPLDHSGSLSVPTLWAEAALAAGGPDDVIAGLAELGDPAGPGGVEPVFALAAALAAASRWEEADAALRRIARVAPRDGRVPLERASICALRGAPAEAIAILEAVVGPTCASGSCSPKDLNALRSLAALQVEHGQPERARELLVHIAHANQGSLGAVDHLVLARYFDRTGDTEAAAEARGAAADLSGVDVDAAAPMLMPAGRRRVL